ncbi:hypothetical protein E1295_47985 [Nonomuraea mesophila]|uniref:Uncharacterized protein n=1 Tax=Nonomuraea mesophila TaxID=2530382 RepID=A0A4R5DWJ6_9ACTN|nr:hypothetical protein [Nonomuraea mesophila]TDE18969.1 hypothetical protein E1295_47985 [Nonomuraea mesophila]
MDIPPASTPVVCDMTTAPDTARQRLEEYRLLFARHLLGRERTGRGVRFRLRAEPGVAAWVRDLAAREKACCAFFAFEVTVEGEGEGEQVIWDCAVSGNDAARAVLEEFYLLPVASSEEVEKRLASMGLDLTADPADPAASAGLH